jgi:hypothetical protein
MKDEEMAEEIANKRCHEIMCFGHCNFNSPKHHRCGEWHREYNCALEGLKAGRPQWHKVADGDLPRQDGNTSFSIEVLASNKKWVYYQFSSGKWFCGNKEVKVIVWKEIVFPELKESE